MEDNIQKALEKLREAQKGMGAYSTDQLQHANNTIKDMKDLIGEAIGLLEKYSIPPLHGAGSSCPTEMCPECEKIDNDFGND